MDFSYVLDSRFRGNDTADPSIQLKCYTPSNQEAISP